MPPQNPGLHLRHSVRAHGHLLRPRVAARRVSPLAGDRETLQGGAERRAYLQPLQRAALHRRGEVRAGGEGADRCHQGGGCREVHHRGRRRIWKAARSRLGGRVGCRLRNAGIRPQFRNPLQGAVAEASGRAADLAPKRRCSVRHTGGAGQAGHEASAGASVASGGACDDCLRTRLGVRQGALYGGRQTMFGEGFRTEGRRKRDGRASERGGAPCRRGRGGRLDNPVSDRGGVVRRIAQGRACPERGLGNAEELLAALRRMAGGVRSVRMRRGVRAVC